LLLTPKVDSMSIALLLEMAAAAHGDRIAVGPRAGPDDSRFTYERLAAAATAGAAVITAHGARHVVFVGVNELALPVTTFAAAWAGVPLAPLNFRLPQERLFELVARLERPLVVCDPAYTATFAGAELPLITTTEFLETSLASRVPGPPAEVPETETALVLFTSGTTSTPKGALLSHSNLLSYVLQTVDLGSAADTDAALISTPPYHIAGMGTIFTNVYAGRRMVHLPDFSPSAWLELARTEKVSSAMVVPTMLARIVDHLDGEPARVDTLRSLAYGGARMPSRVLEQALQAFPTTGFVNAYGLTETSSTIAVLAPEDHRLALTSNDPVHRERLRSVGQVVPGVEVQVRDETGQPSPAGEPGLLWVRGGQVSGQYLGRTSTRNAEGWFPTNDRVWLDTDGYLFVVGRADDTIIRGGENIAPEEIEDVLVHHPAVGEVAVVGVPDLEWGERIIAVVVPRVRARPPEEEIRAWVRGRLRGSRTPDEVRFADHLPRNALGKLVRRELVARLTADGHGLAESAVE
jgi:acyl-CoA synthetase (AMP-forming)/AMP-acid ligase II